MVELISLLILCPPDRSAICCVYAWAASLTGSPFETSLSLSRYALTGAVGTPTLCFQLSLFHKALPLSSAVQIQPPSSELLIRRDYVLQLAALTRERSEDHLQRQGFCQLSWRLVLSSPGLRTCLAPGTETLKVVNRILDNQQTEVMLTRVLRTSPAPFLCLSNASEIALCMCQKAARDLAYSISSVQAMASLAITRASDILQRYNTERY